MKALEWFCMSSFASMIHEAKRSCTVVLGADKKRLSGDGMVLLAMHRQSKLRTILNVRYSMGMVRVHKTTLTKP